MLDKLKHDELLPHKIGMLAGAVLGVLLGMVVSAEADELDVIEMEEVPDETAVQD